MPKHIDRILKQTKYKKDPDFEHQRTHFTHIVQEEKSFNCVDKVSQTNILAREVDTLVKAFCIFSNPNFPTKSHKSHLHESNNKLIWSAQFSTYVTPTLEPIQLVDSTTQTLLTECIDIFEDPSEFYPTSIPFYVIDPNNTQLVDASLLTGTFQPFHHN